MTKNKWEPKLGQRIWYSTVKDGPVLDGYIVELRPDLVRIGARVYSIGGPWFRISSLTVHDYE